MPLPAHLPQGPLRPAKIINPRDSGVANAAFNNRLGIINPASMAAPRASATWNSPTTPRTSRLCSASTRSFSSRSPVPRAGAGRGQRPAGHRPQGHRLASGAGRDHERGKVRNYSRLIRERGRMFLSHVQNWYGEERFYTFASDGGTVVAPVRGAALRVPARLSVVSGSTIPCPGCSSARRPCPVRDGGHRPPGPSGEARLVRPGGAFGPRRGDAVAALPDPGRRARCRPFRPGRGARDCRPGMRISGFQGHERQADGLRI